MTTPLQQDLFVSASKDYEAALKDSVKKNMGIYYTDVNLAKKIIKELKIEGNPVILDPCCGTGNFIFASLKQGFSNVYGADVESGSIDLCKKNMPNAKFVVTDSLNKSGDETLSLLGIDLNKKVDYVLGNPPYVPINGRVPLSSEEYLFKRKVSSSGNNLFVAALIRSFEFLKKDGTLAYIIPKNFLHVSSYSVLRKEILKEKTIISIIDLGSYFEKVRGEQVILIVKNSLPGKNKIRIKKLCDDRFVKLTQIPQEFYSDEILLFSDEYDFSIYKKLSNSYEKLEDLINGYVGRGRSKNINAISGKEIRKFGYKNRPVPEEGSMIFIQNIYSAESGIIAAFGGNFEASETITVFTDGDEKMCKYILGILHSRLCNFFLYRYCFNYSKLTMHTDAKYLNKIPLPKQNQNNFDIVLDCVSRLETGDYMSQDWFNNLNVLNQTVYEAYGLNDEESNYIDNEVKLIQSKKWYPNE